MFLLICFIFTVVWILMSFNNLGNLEFFIITLLLIYYLMTFIKNKENFVVQEESMIMQEECSNDDCKENSFIHLVTQYLRRGSKKLSKYDSVLISSIYDYIHHLKGTVGKLRLLPTEVKKRVVPELDRLIKNTPFPKDPYGGMEDIVTLDSTLFPDSIGKNPTLLKTISNEYKSCDLVFRDLFFHDKVLYMKLFGLKPI